MVGNMPLTPKRRGRCVLIGVLFSLIAAGGLATAPQAEADIVRGIQKIIGGVLSIPMSTLAGTFNGPPIIGTLVGALGGTVNGVGMLLSGVMDLAASAVPVAKTVAPYLIPAFL